MFANDLTEQARELIDHCRKQDLRIAVAESCTGGLISALLTEIAGSSDVFERGFVTYSNAAKVEMLGVPSALIERNGAVSTNVALAMAEGALQRSHASLAISITGIAGPGGGSPHKPVGLVYIALAKHHSEPVAHRFTFTDHGRQSIRFAALSEALRLLREAV